MSKEIDAPEVTYFDPVQDRRLDGLAAVVARWNATAVYRLVDGAWRNAHVHWSYLQPELRTAVSEDVPS